MKREFRRTLCWVLSIVTGIGTFTYFDAPNVLAGSSVPVNAVGRDVSGTQMVYMKNDGDWDIYLYDLATGVEQRVTDAPGTQGYPAVSGRYVVWQDNRSNNPAGTSSKSDIYLYDTETKEAKKINQHEGYNHDVEMQGTHVVWLDNSEFNSNIYVYDIETGVESKITSDSAQAFGVQVEGEVVAWMDARSGGMDIFSYNLSSGQETQLTSGSGMQSEPKITGGTVVWHDYRNGVRQVFAYDSATGAEKKLSAGDEESTLVAADDGKVLFREGGSSGRLVMFDSDADKKYQLFDVNVMSDTFAIEGGRLFWSDDGVVVSESFDHMTLPYEEGQEQNPPPTPNGDHHGETADSGWTVLTTTGGTVSSADSLFALTVPSGAVNATAGIKVTPEFMSRYAKPLPPHYQSVGQPYRVEQNGSLQGSLKVEVKLPHSDSIRLDEHRLVLYRFEERTQDWHLVRTDFKTFGQAQIDAGELGTFVLAYYNAPFSDVKSHWAKEKVEALAAHQIIKGYEDGQFRPNDRVTRAEFVQMIVSALDVAEKPEAFVDFQDIDGHWAKGAIQTAAQNGIIFGEDGLFRPNQPITRQEMIAILMRAAHFELSNDGDVLSRFSDATAVASWAKGPVQGAVQLGLINGREGKIAPQDNTTRGEAATVICNMLERR